MFDHSNTVDKKATKKTLINMFASIKNNGTLSRIFQNALIC